MGDHPTKPSGISRREFFKDATITGLKLTSAGTVLASNALWPSLLYAAGPEGLPNCGPPPKAAPHRRKAGESMAPLPLPVTPLRRTERKRPPAPPSLIGKMNLGTVKWQTVDGKRVATNDWMTDPADINSLLKWTNTKLGVHYKPTAVHFNKFSFNPAEIPALLISAHNGFTFTDKQRAQLARYVMDGGMLIGDACCGWPKFRDAFRKEMQKMFPGRPMVRLEADDPLFMTYYKIHDLTYQRKDGSRFKAPPNIEGIYFGCRIGVAFSPSDLSCGWDGHDHPWGDRVFMDDARQVGANYVTYLLANYQLGRFLSTQKVYHEEGKPSRDDLVFAQVMHGGDWDPDPSAVHNLLKFAQTHTTMQVKFKRANVSLDKADIMDHPILYMTGHRSFRFSAREVQRLRRYLEAGGLLIADACCGRLSFNKAFRREIARVLPGTKLERLALDHPIYQSPSKIQRVAYTPLVEKDFPNLQVPRLEGIKREDRLCVIYSEFDLGDGWEQFPHPYSRGYASDDALRIGLNVLVYSMLH